MSEYFGSSVVKRVRIVSARLWGGKYTGQECDAVIYKNSEVNPQLDTEQLTPPMPKWQSCKLADIQVIG